MKGKFILRSAPFLILIFISHCAFAITEQPQKPNGESLCAEIHNSYECALKLEAAWLSVLQGRVDRKQDTLSLRLKNGRTLVRNDTPGEFEDFSDSSGNTNKKFSLVDYLEKEGYYIVEIGYYEGSAYEFIRTRNGTSLIISGIDLQFSPDRKRFAILEVESYWSEEDQVIEIWTISAAGLKREWRYAPQTWLFFNLRWIDSKTIEILTSKEKFAEIRQTKAGWNVLKLEGTKPASEVPGCVLPEDFSFQHIPAPSQNVCGHTGALAAQSPNRRFFQAGMLDIQRFQALSSFSADTFADIQTAGFVRPDGT